MGGLVLSDLGKQTVIELRCCKRDLWCCLPVTKKLVIFKRKFCYRSLICGSECVTWSRGVHGCPAVTAQWHGGFSFVSNRSRGQEAAEHCPEEHGDRAGRGDEELDDSPGEPGVNRWEHEQLQLWGKVSSIYSCGFLTFLHETGGCFSMKLVIREKHSECCRSCSVRIPFTSQVSLMD